jgi:hypothetical protein
MSSAPFSPAKEYLWSATIAVALVLILGTVATLPGWSPVGIVLGPGLLLAAIFFPQGIHSDWPYLYGAIAIAIDVLLFALVVLLIRRMIARWQRKA